MLQEAESIGSSAVFECQVSPSTAITSWMKDGSNLREGPKHKFTSDGKDRKLHIIDVQLSDTGEYTCVAKNAGKEITCTAKLIVEGKGRVLICFFFLGNYKFSPHGTLLDSINLNEAQWIQIQRSCVMLNTILCFSSELPVKWVKELEVETTCMKGQPMYLTCELNKERDVVWKRNGEVIKTKAGKVAINIIGLQHAVTIQNATEDDAGAYTCEVDGQEEVKTTTNVKVIGEQTGQRQVSNP